MFQFPSRPGIEYLVLRRTISSGKGGGRTELCVHDQAGTKAQKGGQLENHLDHGLLW